MNIISPSTFFRAVRPLCRYDATAFIHNCRSRSYQTHNGAKRSTPPQHSHSQFTSRRSFSISHSIRATVVAQNPRQDEDGNEMTIAISERAAKRLKQITSTTPKRNTLTSVTSSPPDSHLRVTVTSGGCHGFQYLMALEPSDKIDPEEDTVFVAEGEGASAGGNVGSAKVVLDESSLELLKGSTVDFTTELIGSQFKIVGNPRATSSCGCGTSFDIE